MVGSLGGWLGGWFVGWLVYDSNLLCHIAGVRGPQAPGVTGLLVACGFVACGFVACGFVACGFVACGFVTFY